MPTWLIAVFGAFIVALYVGFLVDMVRRQLGLSRPLKPFPRQEDLVSAGASEHIASLLANGRKFDAIMAYRQEGNLPGRHAAKAAVETLYVHAQARFFIRAGAAEDVARHLAENNRIGAIRAYKDANGVTLPEAKEAIDTLLKH